MASDFCEKKTPHKYMLSMYVWCHYPKWYCKARNAIKGAIFC